MELSIILGIISAIATLTCALLGAMRMLTPNGIAAIIVSNDLMDSKKEADIREEIFSLCQVV